MTLNHTAVIRTLIGIAIVVAMVGCNKESGAIKVKDQVFVQPYTVRLGQPQSGIPYWTEVTVTGIKGDSATIQPSEHWKDVAPDTEGVLTVRKDILAKVIPLKANEIKIGMPVLARQIFLDSPEKIVIIEGTIAKIEGDTFSVAFEFDQVPETTKIDIKGLWKFPTKTK